MNIAQSKSIYLSRSSGSKRERKKKKYVKEWKYFKSKWAFYSIFRFSFSTPFWFSFQAWPATLNAMLRLLPFHLLCYKESIFLDLKLHNQGKKDKSRHLSTPSCVLASIRLSIPVQAGPATLMLRLSISRDFAAKHLDLHNQRTIKADISLHLAFQLQHAFRSPSKPDLQR